MEIEQQSMIAEAQIYDADDLCGPSPPPVVYSECDLLLDSWLWLLSITTGFCLPVGGVCLLLL